ncbi:hypothetical protein ACHHYP_12314 [Achlya hypogyna]|uniref:Uncharacterized protein n=1 Tax=Achlya hypogyna TaxID=1202772 RepID=A0A1V9ZH01_ACHHY|nr:hypothetical protein ACHHYP_12314 [Achlya hypogyna]
MASMQHSDGGVLRGHKRPVNCLAKCATGAPHLMASGSEDSTCRLWDLRTHKVATCISKAFAGEAVNSIAFPSSHEIYVASHNQLYMFDLRAGSMILTEATTIFEPAADEINSLALHPMPAKKPWLAVPDDEGEIGVVNLQSRALMTTLRGQHTNIAMTAAFRPKCAGYDLVTGGLDCHMVFWEMNGDRGTGRMRFKLNMQMLVSEDALGDATQVWNPPFVHDLKFNTTGRTVAAALGDGSVALVDFASRSLTRRLRTHTAAVSCVEFVPFHGTELLVSAANDAKVAVWDLKAADARATPYVIPHQHRPNALATHVDSDALMLYVGDDTTSTIAMYRLQ